MYIVRVTQQILKMVNLEGYIYLIIKLFCVCPRSCMVMAAHVARQKGRLMHRELSGR